MRRSLAVTGFVTAGVTALALAASPVLAQPGPNNGGSNSGTCPMTGSAPLSPGGNATGNLGSGPAYGRGSGMNGSGMNGGGMMNGSGGGMRGPQASLAPMGTLNASQQATLASMAEEEKLAHDVYVALAAKYPADYQFARIANSETMHQSALRTLLARYGLTDPTVGLAAGQFSTSAFQNLYGDLLGQATSAQTALGVGVTVEKLDIADLTSALNGLSAPDVTQVYTSLRNASQHHLAAFGG